MAQDGTKFASNSHGVKVDPVDMSAAGSPSIKTYHGASIENENGEIIGRIQSWNPTTNYSRVGTHVFELNSKTWGKAVDYVPGIQAGGMISMSRFEVWGQEVERAMMGDDAVKQPWASLIEQIKAFTIHEYIFRGEGGSLQVYRHWLYTGCWFQERNESAFEAENDGRITAESTIAYVNRVLLNDGKGFKTTLAPFQTGVKAATGISV